MRKKILMLVLIIVSGVAALPVACGINDEQAIVSTVTNFYEAYQNREYSRCIEYISSRLRNSEGDRNVMNSLQSGRLWSGFVQLKSVGNPKISGNTARVWVDIEKILGLVTSTEVSLIKEGGSRKIDNLQ